MPSQESLSVWNDCIISAVFPCPTYHLNKNRQTNKQKQLLRLCPLCVLGRAQSLWRRQCKTCWIWCMTWARTQTSSSTWCAWSSRSIRTPARRPTGRTWAMPLATWLLSGWWGCLQSLTQRKGPPLVGQGAWGEHVPQKESPGCCHPPEGVKDRGTEGQSHWGLPSVAETRCQPWFPWKLRILRLIFLEDIPELD